MILKLAAVEAVIVAATFDNQAQRIVLLAAAVGAIAILWRQVVRPLGRLLHAGVAVVRRTAAAVDVLEHLPAKWREVDERVSSVEAEVGIAHTEIAAVEGKVDGIANELAAVRRELGVADDQVRSLDNTP